MIGSYLVYLNVYNSILNIAFLFCNCGVCFVGSGISYHILSSFDFY